ALPGHAHRAAAGVDHLGLLLGLHLSGGRRTADRPLTNDQDPAPGRPHPAPRLPGGGHMSTADLHLDTGAMALGALPDDESEAVQAHLETCESCTAELAGFRETVAMMGAVSAEAPAASLRGSSMPRIAVTPQLPPLVAPLAPAQQTPIPATVESEAPAQPKP